MTGPPSPRPVPRDPSRPVPRDPSRPVPRDPSRPVPGPPPQPVSAQRAPAQPIPAQPVPAASVAGQRAPASAAGAPGRRSRHGLFIVFEGGDGVGKTTQTRALVDWLATRKVETVRTFEPGDSAVGQQIRHLVLDPATGEVDPRAEALLYAADKAQHLFEVVEPALGRGAVVVCDRYVDSLLAYQGAGRSLSLPELERVARWATGDLRPHLTVLLDLDPRQAVSRKQDKDRVEGAGEAFHLRARGHFLDLAAADPEHYLVLPARDDRERLTAAIRDRVVPLLAGLSGPPVTMVR